MAESKKTESKAGTVFRVGSDRLYGLDKKRRVLETQVQSQAGQSVQQSDVTIDRANNRLGIAMPVFHGAYSLPASAPANTTAADAKFLTFLQGREPQSGAIGKTFAGRDENARIRRASKLGVDFTRQSGGTVHFMLDGIDQEAVVRKRNYGKSGWKDITGSELRHIYRNQTALGDSVQFQRGGKPAQAPWVSNPDLWAEYKPGSGQAHSWPDAGGGTPRSGGSPAASPPPSPRADPPQRAANAAAPRAVRRNALPALQRRNSGWNSSTRIDRPLSETATKSTVRQRSASVTGKIGSRNWK